MAIDLRHWLKALGDGAFLPASVLVAALSAGFLFWPQAMQAPSPRSAARHHALNPAHSVASAKPPAKKPAAPTKPPEPSVFALESAMTYAQRMNRWKPIIREASRRFTVPEAWIWAVMRMESGGKTMIGENRPITSRAGAMGLMQVMPDTYAAMRRLYGLGPNAYEPHDSIMAGAAVLKILSGKYRYPAFFAAYNAGPSAVDLNLAGTRALPAETTAYVAGVTRVLNGGGIRGLRVRLTRPDGSPVLIDSGAVVSIRAALPGEYAPGVRAVIGIGRLRQGVREDAASATAIIGRGGRI